MAKYLYLSLLALLALSSIAQAADIEEVDWVRCSSPMDHLWNKTALTHTHITTSGDGQTIYVHSVISANTQGMFGRYFFKSRDGGVTWSVLNKKRK
jgi:hypothetical protein